MQRLNSFKSHVGKIGIVQTISYLLQRLMLKKGALIKVKVPGFQHPLLLRNKYYDTHIFNQIFIREEVKFGNDERTKVVVDCGANIGLSTLFFWRRFLNCLIVSIEPELSNFNMLVNNTRNYENISCLHAAVWSKNTNVNVIDTGEGVASFITNEDKNSGNIIEQINAITINEVMLKYDLKFIDLLKIDIEGSEYELFNHNPEAWTDKINMLAVEIHEGLKPGVTSLINSKLGDKFTRYNQGEYSVFKKNPLNNEC